MSRPTHTWTVADAKARLGEVIDRTLSIGPQTITRRGRRIVVVVGVDEWEQRSRQGGTLADFFANSPLRDSGLEIPGRHGIPRNIRL
jgi:prevent-host-death family protein